MQEKSRIQLNCNDVVEVIVKHAVPGGLLVSLPDYNIKTIIRNQEIAFEKVNSTVISRFKSGYKAKAKVYEIDYENGDPRYMLSIRLAESDPWDDIKQSLKRSEDPNTHEFIMEIYFRSHSHIIGEIAPGIKAMVDLKAIRDYFEQDNLESRLNWDWEPLRGDFVAGYLEKIEKEKRLITLDIVKCLKNKKENPPTIQKYKHIKHDLIKKQKRSLPSTKHLRILLIDDIPALALASCKMINQLGYNASTTYEEHDAQNYQQDPEAIEKAKMYLEQNVIHIVLLDTFLPELDHSFNLLIHLKKKFPRIMTILTSGDIRFPQEIDWTPVNEVSILGHLYKPLQKEEIHALIEESKFRSQIPISQYFSTPHIEPKTDIQATQPVRTFEQHLKEELKKILIEIGGNSGAVFSIQPVSHEVSLETAYRININDFNDSQQWLSLSPVKDCALDRERIFTSNAQTPEYEGKHRNLLKLLKYQSCIGLPVDILGDSMYCIFIFSDENNLLEKYIFQVEKTVFRIEKLAFQFRKEDEMLRDKIDANDGITYRMLVHEMTNQIATVQAQLSNFRTDWNENKLSRKEVLNQTLAMEKCIKRMSGIRRIFRKFVSKPVKENCFLASVFHEVIYLADFYCQHESIDCSISDPEIKTSPPALYMNKIQLTQIFFNILINAIQQTNLFRQNAEVHINITINIGLINQTERALMIDITDNGPGIHKKDFKHIFRPVKTTRKDGAGLGLYLCRRTLKAVGGDIFVLKSILYSGTTFRIIFSLDDA